MAHIKKSKQFVFMLFILLLSTYFIYILAYLFIGKKEINISHSYKQFMIQYTKGVRLIIDSGSNSKYSIDAYALEKEFGIQTLNLGDNAGYPLSQKLIRLEKYLNKNDIILLPLEWQYYARKKSTKLTHQIYTANLLGKLNYYYIYPSLWDKLKLIFYTPFPDFVVGVKDKYNFYKNQNTYLRVHLDSFINHERGSLTTNRLFDKSDKRTCDQYVLAEQLKNGFSLSERFKQNVKTIKNLRAKGHQVILTWPVVVGDDCYGEQNKTKLDMLILEIKDYLKQNKIPIIGDPYENRFYTKDILDTFYHINLAAKKVRTQKLIEHLKKSSISKKSDLSYKENIKASKDSMISLLEKTYKVDEKIDFKLSSVLFSGWSQAEKDFRWSSGKKSKLTFKLNTKDIKGILSLHVRTLGKQNIVVHINDQHIDSQLVESNDTIIKLKFNPKILQEINTISFDFPNAHQPNEEDKRVLAMALISFMIE